MKIIFILVTALLSFSAFSGVSCSFKDLSGRQMDIELSFHPKDEVSSILIIDNLKIPVSETYMVFAYGHYFVEAITKLDNAKVVLFAFPRQIFSGPQDTFLIKTKVDEMGQMSSCNFIK